MDNQPQKNSGTAWLLWILANTAGATIGVAITFAAIYALGADNDRAITFLLVPAIAICVGVAQWLVIRKYMPRAIAWIAASIAGLFVGAAMISAVAWIANATLSESAVAQIMQGRLSMALPLSLYGASIGFTQWLFLRRFARHSQWWILASAIGAALFGIFTGNSISHIADLIWIISIPTAITGFVLAKLVQQPVIRSTSKT